MKLLNFKRNKTFCLLLSFFSLVLVFIAGSFKSSTHLEKIAEYASEIVKTKTANQELCAITVESNDKTGKVIDPISEFRQLYGTFRQEKITFVSATNTDKFHDIRIDNCESNSLSFVYLGATGTEPYNSSHFKHRVFPIETMFPDKNVGSGGDCKVYISQSQADNLLLNDQQFNNVSDVEYDNNDYETLIGKKIIIHIDGDGNDAEFLIQNIYLETGYYYDGIKEVMGEFVATSYYYPKDLIGEMKNVYFLSKYSYQNEYFMKHINASYPSKKYTIKLNPFNIVSDYEKINTKYLLSFYYSESIYSLDWLAIVITVLSAISLVYSLLIFIFIEKNKKNPLFAFVNIFSLLAPYLVFKILFYITKDVAIMSGYSSRLNFFFVVGYVLISGLCLLIGRKKQLSSFEGINYEEINV